MKYYILLCILLYLSIIDIYKRDISNIYPCILFLLGISFSIYESTIVWNSLSFLTIFLITYLLWFKGIIGGADVKIYAATAIWIPDWKLALFLFSITWIVGFLLIVIDWFLEKMFSNYISVPWWKKNVMGKRDIPWIPPLFITILLLKVLS